MATDPGYPGPTSPMLGARLRIAAEAVHQAFRDRIRQAGHTELRPAHLALLQFPGPHGVRPTELAARVGLRKQALNPLLNDLEQLGYLQRANDDQDRRSRRLLLTARGMSMMRIMRETLEDLERRMIDQVGADNYRQFLAVLDQVPDVAADRPLADRADADDATPKVS